MQSRIEGISVSAVSMMTMDHGTEPPGACAICSPPAAPFGKGATGVCGLSILDGNIISSPRGRPVEPTMELIAPLLPAPFAGLNTCPVAEADAASRIDAVTIDT